MPAECCSSEITAIDLSLSPPTGNRWNSSNFTLSSRLFYEFILMTKLFSLIIFCLDGCNMMKRSYYSVYTSAHSNATLISIHISEQKAIQQKVLLQIRARGIFLHLIKLTPATALPSFMVRKIRCQTRFSQEGGALCAETCWLGMFSSSTSDLVFFSGPQQSKSSYGFKTFHCLLNHKTNCPGSSFEWDFFFLPPSKQSPTAACSMIQGSPHLIKWTSLSLLRITHQSAKRW